ncbi:MAG TPA: transporter substrate-binding domain-containing protein [Oceanospirillales bacterium]|nr:transporter substrate-binding domain-containing protein [Oceanospirillales bacterium]
MRKLIPKYNLFNVLLLIFVLYLFVHSPKNHLNQWQIIQKKSYITWITRSSPLTYYNGLDGIIGLEYDILQNFCEQHKLNLRVINASSNTELFNLFTKRKYDIAGANFSFTEQRAIKYQLSDGYDSTYVELVSSYRKPKIKSLKLLDKYTGLVLKDSSYEMLAQNLIKEYAANIKETQKSLYEILLTVTSGGADYSLADNNILQIYSIYVPKLRRSFKLSDNNDLVFLLQKHADNSLTKKLNEFIKKYKESGKVERYKEFILQSLPRIKPADTVNFLKNYDKRWYKIRPLVYKIAQLNKINPILLGAIAYQESHWNPEAVSPTQVKGIMMLTKQVAKEQKVTNRLDAAQSLRGGAQYFNKMLAKVPARIVEPDRTNFALAAYNLGYGNLERARVLTQKSGKNPDLWQDVKQFLPELNKISNNKINGKTAVNYVENIHIYQNLLQWKEQL